MTGAAFQFYWKQFQQLVEIFLDTALVYVYFRFVVEKRSQEPNRKGKNPTYLDVARAANVSPATVTRVLTGVAGVSKDMAARVRRAAESLNVDLEQGNRSRILAFILSNRELLHPFQARVLLGAESYCASQGWELLFLSFRYPLSSAHRDIHLPHILNQRQLLRGVILGGTNSAGFLSHLATDGMPFSVLGNNVVGDWRPEEYSVVSSDDTTGACELVRDLIAQGHRDIWYAGDLDLPWYARCAEGYRLAMNEAGLEPRIQEVHAPDRELGYLTAKSILRTAPVTAIFAGNDQVAVGVYRALGEAGVSIPGDISVAGFNDSQGSNLYPRLTSVREFPEETGQHMAELVVERILNPDAPPRQILLPTELVRRESSAPRVHTGAERQGSALTPKPANAQAGRRKNTRKKGGENESGPAKTLEIREES